MGNKGTTVKEIVNCLWLVLSSSRTWLLEESAGSRALDRQLTVKCCSTDRQVVIGASRVESIPCGLSFFAYASNSSTSVIKSWLVFFLLEASCRLPLTNSSTAALRIMTYELIFFNLMT